MMMTFLMMLRRRGNDDGFFDDSQKEGDDDDFPEFDAFDGEEDRDMDEETFFMDESVDEKEKVEKEKS